jgi:hypothetical protein
MALFRNHPEVGRTLLIGGVCGLCGMVLDVDHIMYASGAIPIPAGLVRPEPHYWALLIVGLVFVCALAFICGLSAWMVLNKKREVIHES